MCADAVDLVQDKKDPDASSCAVWQQGPCLKFTIFTKKPERENVKTAQSLYTRSTCWLSPGWFVSAPSALAISGASRHYYCWCGILKGDELLMLLCQL